MAGMMACASKLEKVCCSDMAFRKEMCVPAYYCQVAIGERPAGPVPPCGGPSIGDPLKCDKDEATLKSEAKYGLARCEKQLQELYDLERSLVECAHEVAIEKSSLEQESQQVQQIADDAQKCRAAKATPSGDGVKTQIKGQSFCTAHKTEIEAAYLTLAKEETVCINDQIPKIEVHIPNIEITIPKIHVDGNISSPDFNVDMQVQVPDFGAPSFDGGIVVPGGGGKLNVPMGHKSQPLTLDQRRANVNADLQACKDSKAKVAPTKDRVRSAHQNAEAQKAKACDVESGSFLEGPADTIIEVLSMQKVNPFFARCTNVGGAIDALIAVLREC